MSDGLAAIEAVGDFFIVHSCSPVDVTVPAVTNTGRMVEAKVPGVVVELVPETGYHGTVTRYYIPDNEDQITELLDKYKIGVRIEIITKVAVEQPKPVAPAPAERVTVTATPSTPPVVNVPQAEGVTIATPGSSTPIVAPKPPSA